MLDLSDAGCLVDLLRLSFDRPVRFVGWAVLHVCTFWMRPRPRWSATLERLIGACVLLTALGVSLSLAWSA